MTGRRWTKKEIKRISFIRRKRSIDLDKLSKELNRSANAIKRMRSDLRIASREVFPKLPKLTEWDASYIAGIIDGEGSFSGDRLAIANTCYPLIKWLKKKIPLGKIYLLPRSGKQLLYNFRIISNVGILWICEVIKPYVKVKKKDVNSLIRKLRKNSKVASYVDKHI